MKWPAKAKNQEGIVKQIHPPISYNKDPVVGDKWSDDYLTCSNTTISKSPTSTDCDEL